MRRLGFSTGALALGDFRKGLDLCRQHGLRAVELSALRLPELEPLVQALPALDLSGFEYVSLHAPSRYAPEAERRVASFALEAAERGIPVIVHPDAICDPLLWKPLGAMLTIENMDRRKPLGRSAAELEPFFERLPDAWLCFDLGHARQFDPSMVEAELLLVRYRGRIRQLHVSEVNTFSRHERLSWLSYFALQHVAPLLPADVPAILEACVEPEQIDAELQFAEACLTPAPAPEKTPFASPLAPSPAAGD